MKSKNHEENCLKQLGVRGKDSYEQECCDSLDNIYASILSALNNLYWDFMVFYNVSVAEYILASNITKGDNYSVSPSKADRMFEDFREKVLGLFEVVRRHLEEADYSVDFVSANLERVYQNCEASPVKKIRFYNKLKKKTQKAKKHLYKAHDGIKKAITALRDAKHLTDEENLVIFDEQWLSALDGVYNAIDEFCDMYKALAGFAEKYSVFQSALHC